MEKKVVSKELYNCLNYLIKFKGKEWAILKHTIKVHVNKSDWISEDFKPLNGLTLDDLADLLYNGYQLEETKEEKLVRYFKDCDSNDFRNGIIECLDVMEIEIKGINK